MAGRTTRPVSPPELAARLAGLERPLHVFFDFDGTLSPIAPTPDEARLPARTRRALAALARSPGTHVAVLSARGVAELARKVRLRDVALLGLYGLEQKLPERARVRLPLAWDRSRWTGLRRELERAAARANGALVEWKPPAIAVHDRAVAPGPARRLARTVRAIARRERETVELRPGSRVLELVPRGTPDKGIALERWLAARPWRSVAYFGDSAGDEPAFRAVRRRGGLAVRVGPRRGPTAAALSIEGPGALVEALELMIPSRAPRRAPGTRASP
jgi:trehalose 6-phosphate phosphatase